MFDTLSDKSQGPQRFLHNVAMCTITGNLEDTDVSAQFSSEGPLPLSARRLVDHLKDADSPKTIATVLKPQLNRWTQVSRLRRAILVLGYFAFPLFMTVLIIASLSGIRSLSLWREAFALTTCLDAYSKANGEDTSSNTIRAALEIYIPARFHSIIRDELVWRTPITFEFWDSPLFTQKATAIELVQRKMDVVDAEILKSTIELVDTSVLPNSKSNLPSLPTLAAASLTMYLFVCAAIPGLVCAFIFRGGLVQLLCGFAVVSSTGKSISRKRTLFRSFIVWCPIVLFMVVALLLEMFGIIIPLQWSIVPLLVYAILEVASIALPNRGIPDRLAGTYLVAR